VVATGSRLVTTAGPAGNLVGRGDHLAQARQTLSDLELALEAVGAKESDVVKTTQFM
jgi:enamine deaminase RidA (YjgF/YER057c/UK114 family)